VFSFGENDAGESLGIDRQIRPGCARMGAILQVDTRQGADPRHGRPYAEDMGSC
jgi:hypothetical protein